MFDKQGVKNISWNVLALVLEKMLAITITLLIVNSYGNEYLGYYSLFLALVATSSSFMSSGMASFILYKINVDNLFYIKKVNLLVNFFLLFIFIFIFMNVNELNLKSEIVSFDNNVFIFIFFSFIFSQVVISNYTNYFRSLGLYKTIAKISFFKNFIIIIILLILSIYCDFNNFLILISFSYLVTSFIYVLFFYYFNDTREKGVETTISKVLFEVVSFSKFFIIASFINSYLVWLVRDFIADNYGLLELSAYTVAFQISLMFTFVTGSLGTVFIKKLKETDLSSTVIKSYYSISLKLITSIFIIFLIFRNIIFDLFLISNKNENQLISFMFYFCVFSFVWLLGPTLTAKAKGGIYLLLVTVKALFLFFLTNFSFDILNFVFYLSLIEILVFIVYIIFIEVPFKYFANSLIDLLVLFTCLMYSCRYNLYYFDYIMCLFLVIYIIFNKNRFLHEFKQ